MGINVMDIFPNAVFPLFIQSMYYEHHDFMLTPIVQNGCMLFDWTFSRNIKEAICDIKLEDGFFCTLRCGSKREPGIEFRKEVQGKNLGEIIGFAPFKKDLSGIREDIDYDFLYVKPGVSIPGFDKAGTMQSLTQKLSCD